METQPNSQSGQATLSPLVTPQPKKWYQHKGLVAIAILAVLATIVSWLVLSRNKNSEINIGSLTNVTKNWQTYTDNENGFSLQYPSNLYIVPSDVHYSTASSTGEFSIQNVPGPQLFKYYIDPTTNNRTFDSKPYKREGFTVEVQPASHGGEWSQDYFTEQVAFYNECKIETMIPITISGTPAYKYLMTGEYIGEIRVIIPYNVSDYVEVHFQSSYSVDSSDYQKALKTFEQIINTFNFTKTTPQQADVDQARTKAISEITWKKYSNPFIEFEHSSDFELDSNVVITEHKINANTRKDSYGLVGISFRNNTLDDGRLDIDIWPTVSPWGEERFLEMHKAFDKEEKEPHDYFQFTTIDGFKASKEFRETYDRFNYDSCDSALRLGSKRIIFYNTGFVYEITMTWTKEENNSSESLLQKEFDRIISTFKVLNH